MSQIKSILSPARSHLFCTLCVKNLETPYNGLENDRIFSWNIEHFGKTIVSYEQARRFYNMLTKTYSYLKYSRNKDVEYMS